MTWVDINANRVDAKSPIDDTLMEDIKGDLDDLDSRVIAAGNKPFIWEIIGKLSDISDQRRSLCFGVVNDAFVPNQARFMLKKSGSGGSFAFDVRRQTIPNTAITAISHQYTAATSSIAQQGSGLATQSIARATTQISTQSITHAKSAKNTQSVILLGTIDGVGVNLVQYNLDAAISADTIVGDSIVMASHTSSANDGTFPIIEIGRNGGNNVVVENAAGVAQTGVAGTVQEKIMSYNFTNPVNSLFGTGYSHLFASHTSSVNDGTLPVYAINQSGNNIWVKNAAGVTQGGAAGTADTFFWTFTFLSAVDTTDYQVGQYAKTSSHSSGGNNAGALKIIAVNSGGNNLILYNTSGVAQGGVAGTTNCNMWKYNLPSDPTSDVSVSDTMYMSGHTSALNDGTFTIYRVTASTVVVYNESGVAQASTPGNVYTTKKKIQFAADMSATYTTDSYIEMQNCVDSTYNAAYTRSPFRVLQVNRGGGANYNVVIDNPTGAAQSSPAGIVSSEMKSIFTVAPTLAAQVVGLTPSFNISGQSDDVVSSSIPESTPLLFYITSFQTGDPQDLTFYLL